MIGNLLVLTGFFIILIGFLMLIIGIATGLRRGSESETEDKKRMKEYGKEAESENSFRYTGNEKEPYAEKARPEIKGGGVIMLGPIPIIFGSDKESASTAIILAIILMVLSLLIFRGVLF
ncbi:MULTISPECIES: TIGR00304 family membrane protein [Methanosarcina]|uniref:TIGR00304 family protein n=7 Tax=Methanosarcina mazei TaxID=2209 RepID=A0A0F8M7K5_METMZ|nr:MULTISPECIES: TIGR00304 family protein [Methanosarcina]AGF96227.1 hypothetical protein MmTuc01_0821 [Methanosarcina mazei Tuc01]KKG01442.1 hypothetical protein DU31_02550 [Methanosarcina mazei]KKG02562.1 hypothetical protein DU47_03765 [Methanosarcina mazei]KKG05194.1 hypothetical protein DU40_05570 [Methanosarcina mazei]KKG18975.1 hypothetical protein DU34_10570 [Methanosarcina mazei]